MWKHIQKTKQNKTTKEILSKKNNARGITISSFKLHYEDRVIKMAGYWPKQTKNRTIGT